MESVELSRSTPNSKCSGLDNHNQPTTCAASTSAVAAAAAATELLLPSILPTASLSSIQLTFSFKAKNSDSLPAANELLPLADVALRSLWNDGIAPMAPVVGSLGYLQALAEREGFLETITDVFMRVGKKTGDPTLQRSVKSFDTEGKEGERGGGGLASGIEKALWRVVLKESYDSKKGEVLKGLVCFNKAEEDAGGGEMLFADSCEHVEEEKKLVEQEDMFLFDEENPEECEEDFEELVEDNSAEPLDEDMFSWGDEDASMDDIMMLDTTCTIRHSPGYAKQQYKEAAQAEEHDEILFDAAWETDSFSGRKGDQTPRSLMGTIEPGLA